jgi:hypothetical protein
MWSKNSILLLAVRRTVNPFKNALLSIVNAVLYDVVEFLFKASGGFVLSIPSTRT